MTQLQPRFESWQGGDQSWLASSFGTTHPRTATLDPAKHAAKIKNGVLKAGEALALVDGLAVPYDPAGADGSEVLAGFLLTDQSIHADGGLAVVPLLDHGKVRLSRLPSPVAKDAKASGVFIFLEGS